jgi:hypothetical protein
MLREVGDLELEGVEEWLHVLELSVKWNFEAARKFAIKSNEVLMNIYMHQLTRSYRTRQLNNGSSRQDLGITSVRYLPT